MSKILVDLHISAEDYLAHYKGAARSVIARDRSGKNVAFPSNILQPFVTHNGISGTFEIEFDTDNRFQRITRINNR